MYIEWIVLINFLLDFMILYGTKRILKINTSHKRLVLGSIIGSLTTFILYLKITNINLLIIKIIISIIMIIISYGFKYILKNLLYFYLISFQLSGLIYLLDLNTNKIFYYFILIIGCIFVIIILLNEIKSWKYKLKDKYIVKIIIKKKVYLLEGIIDTGNQLKSIFSNKGIILVNLKVQSDKILYIPYKALNVEGIIPCIKPDRIIINNKEITNCLIGLSREKIELEEGNCLLPNILKEELC